MKLNWRSLAIIMKKCGALHCVFGVMNFHSVSPGWTQKNLVSLGKVVLLLNSFTFSCHRYAYGEKTWHLPQKKYATEQRKRARALYCCQRLSCPNVKDQKRWAHVSHKQLINIRPYTVYIKLELRRISNYLTAFTLPCMEHPSARGLPITFSVCWLFQLRKMYY